MIAKKYKLLDKADNGLHRIQAFVDIPIYRVSKGDIGGFVESEKNLSHHGNAWIAGNAKVYGDAKVFENAVVCRGIEKFELSRNP